MDLHPTIHKSLMRDRSFLIIALILFCGRIFPQAKISLSFIPMFNGSALEEGKYYKIGEKDSIVITSLKFYISSIELLNGERRVWKEKNSYHLADISNPSSLKTMLNVPGANFTGIKFRLGIDSLTNVSGAMGGALDPTNGMYWTWQSGYINLKLEGNSSLCKSRKNEFQYHLGGYQKPFYCMQEIKLASGSKEIEVLMDLEKIIDVNKLKEQDHIMSPCKEAVLMAERAAQNLHTKAN
jgi:hypothetical protein